MKARFAVALAVVVAACAAPPPPKPAVAPPQATNALTPASVAKTIAEPRIRVGMMTDQSTVMFPRIDGGYYVIADSGSSTLRRGFTDTPGAAAHQIVDDEGQLYTISGQSILVLPASADTITIDRKPYRGGARVSINARGSFNIINELNLEDYLRGVVPTEMGPKTFDEIEGLKAQAVAARTYAVRNRGQFRAEGYDICPTPTCQAYNGFSGEDPLSNQAVSETAGLVIAYNGQPIDALFTATCGGETSDVGTMFPGRTDPYLKRARCVELEMTTIAGRADAGMMNEQQFYGALFAAAVGLTQSDSWAAGDVQRAVLAAARIAGLSVVPTDAPASSRRGDVLTYLANIFGFDRYATSVTLPEDRPYFFPQSKSDQRPYLAAAFLIKFGFLPAEDIDRVDLSVAMPRDELYSLLGSWLKKHAALSEITGKIQSVNGRQLALKGEGRTTTFNLPDGIPIWRRLVDRYQEYRSVPVMIGDRAFLQMDERKTPIGLVVQANIDGASFDRTSSFANWTRSYRADELIASINKRNPPVPVQQLVALRPITVDASQRIAELEVTAEGGRTFILRGLPIRWSLNIPDNLFVFEKTVDPDGMDRYTFYGKGWGHGIGMCQVGAYGMAFRGYKFDQILKHYYTGVEIAPMPRQ